MKIKLRICCNWSLSMNSNNPSRLLQICGIHPLVAVFTAIVDTMLFANTSVTLGVGWLLSIPIAMFVSLVTFIVQKESFGDGWLLSIAKAMAIGLLIAIPTPIPSTITAGMGILGFLKKPKHQLTESKILTDTTDVDEET